MDLFSPSKIKELLAEYGAAPLKSLGQNFLINAQVLEKIIQAAELKTGDIVLEIGPGLGALTRELAKKTKKVFAIEKDRKYAEILKNIFADFKNVEIIHGDALDIDASSLIEPNQRYKIVANLPYNITSPIIRKFLETQNQPELMVLMIQKEVARRICAKPPEMSLLAVSVQFHGEPKIIEYVSKGNFWPQPKVDSAILKILPHSKFSKIDRPKFFAIVRAGFSAPRKQLAPNLASKLKISRQIVEETLKKQKIDPKQRAETLNIDDWTNINLSF
ncbi:MAG: 16S rRNA (adenine(1518)-N(6)/adenine(1519)-N(6))-dimethyltransferase RsmA [Candidatus Portnoybacteria bacterium]|nr:16S rRNA (adenine(1518)-N(6)/adenine(1519)-N(6))-dimethyltransferase RsmA [Candidatus Portnoybacteria bacterium]